MLLFSLFVSAFVSASIFPFASEVVFLGALEADLDPVTVVIVATAGNSLGAMTTWLLARCIQSGRLGLRESRLSPRATLIYQRYGKWSLLLSWMPIIGDAFPALAGWFKLSFIDTILLVIAAKLARYLVLMSIYFASLGFFTELVL